MNVSKRVLLAVLPLVACSSVDSSSLTGPSSTDSSPRREPAGAAPSSSSSPSASSASSGSGGSADAGDAGPIVKGCAGLPICADFENDVPGMSPAGFTPVLYPDDAGTIAVDTTRAFSGTKSVKLTSARADVVSYVQISKKMKLANNTFFGRMHAWFASVPSDTRHWNLVEGRGYVPGSVERKIEDIIMYQVGGSGPAVGTNYLSWTVDCGNGTASVPWPVQKWTCVEWKFDGIDHELHVWLDGKAIDDVTAINPSCGGKWYAPTFEELNLGWYNAIAESSGPREMWIDDVAVGPSRIGCGL